MVGKGATPMPNVGLPTLDLFALEAEKRVRRLHGAAPSVQLGLRPRDLGLEGLDAILQLLPALVLLILGGVLAHDPAPGLPRFDRFVHAKPPSGRSGQRGLSHPSAAPGASGDAP